MNICAHNIMNGLRKWISETDWNTFRVHLSHSDMDGLACHILTKYTTNLMNPASKSMMLQWTCNAGVENIERSIRYVIEKLEKNSSHPKKTYVKGKKTLFFLITDLGQFNPDFFNKLIEEGHKIQYILIDHHQLDERNLNKIELTGNTEEFQMASNCYYVDTTCCASKSLFNAIQAILTQYRTASMMASSEMKRYYGAIEHMAAYIDRVNQYDLGRWGKWAGLDADEADGSVKEQLFFKSFKPEDMNKYTSLMVNYFQTIRLGLNVSKAEKPFWAIDISKFNSKYYKAVQAKLDTLNEEFIKFKDSLHPVTIPFDTGKYENLNIQEYIMEETDTMEGFSFYSKEILENDQSIDMLILVSKKMKTVELRGAKDDIDCSVIARLNGGGGHPKASGFPFSEEISKKIFGES